MIRALEPFVRRCPRGHEVKTPLRYRNCHAVEHLQDATRARDRIRWQSAADQWGPQQVKLYQRATRSTPARTAETQCVVVDVDVEADICRTIERERQAQSIEYAFTVIKDHVAAREQKRQLAKCFGVRLQWKSTCELGVRRIERIVLADQRGLLAVHAPVRQYAGTVHDNQAVYKLQLDSAEADYVVPRRIYRDYQSSLGRVVNLCRRAE